MAERRSPVRISALDQSVAATTLWRARGQLNVTVVLKATFAIEPGAAMRLVEPEAIVRVDEHHRGDPAASVRVASELGPYLKRADVTLTGHACAPRGRPVPTQVVRLAVLRGRPLLDKTVHVNGVLRDGAPQPFDRIPLVYERALGGPAWEANPVGVGVLPGHPAVPSLASIVLPGAPGRTAGFGPIARGWPARRRLLAALDPAVLDQRIAEIPDTFDWAYLQAAPADQQVDYLHGDEWIVIEGVHPDHPRIEAQLPEVRGEARVAGLTPGIARRVELRADTLHIDADALRCTLVWRGLVPVRDEEALEALDVVVGVELPGRPIEWPATMAVAPSPFPMRTIPHDPAPAAEAPPEDDDEELVIMGGTIVMAADPPAPTVELRVGAPAEPREDERFGGTVELRVGAPAGGAALPFKPATGVAAPLPASPARPAPPPDDDDELLAGTVVLGADAPSGGAALPFMTGAAKPGAAVAGAPPPPPASTDDDDEPLAGTIALGADVPVDRIALPFKPGPSAAALPSSSPAAPPSIEDEGGTAVMDADDLFATLPFTSGGAARARPVTMGGDPPYPPPRAITPAESPEPPAPPPPAEPPPGPSAPEPGASASAAQFYHRLDRPTGSAAAAAVLPPIEPRASDTIPVVTRTPLLAFTLPWETKPGQPARAVVVKATFDIVPGGPAKLRKETEPPSGDVHAGDGNLASLLYPSDFVPFKPKADVTLKGTAHAPKGGAETSVVRFRFGPPRAAAGKGFDRSIAVFGERRWQQSVVKTGPSEPRRFEAVPLVYENAFGGPSFEANPVGAGHGASTRLPSLEDPAHLVKSPGDSPAPACFGAVPMLWHARWSKLGTYGAAWLKTRWPYFPEDFDWAFFQVAPPAQQLDRVEGDEPFELVGMDADHPRIEGSLPRLLPRCFARKTSRALEEVVLRLDTVSFDVDERKLNLVWRGLLEVADDAATEVVELFLMTEPMGGPRLGPAEVEAKYEVARAPLPLVEEEPEAPAPANQASPEEPLGAYDKQLRARLRAAGVLDAAPAAVPVPDGGRPVAAVAPPPSSGTSPAEATEAPEPRRAPRPPPHLDPDRARAVRLLAQGEPLDGADFAEADLSDLDFSGRSLVGANLKDARLVRCRFAGASLAGAQLGGADLTDAVLDGADLQRADLTGANLEAASFAGADVLGAAFTRARGAGAIFRAAHGAQASFAEASWARARFERAELDGADFTRAELDDAVFDGAALPRIRLHDARGSRVSFKDASLEAARADGVSLRKSTLQGVIAESSIWEGAVLDESTFLGAKLRAASFAKASCLRAIFSGADLTEGRLPRAKLAGASFLKANLMTASLEAADLTGADLRGANLHGAETWKAKLKGTELDLAIVTQTKLEVKA